MKEFAILEKTPNVPALDSPGLDAVTMTKAYGVKGMRAENAGELAKCFEEALGAEGPLLIEFPVDPRLRPSVAPVAEKKLVA